MPELDPVDENALRAVLEQYILFEESLNQVPELYYYILYLQLL